jgi:AcrR family transcriptional regulator
MTRSTRDLLLDSAFELLESGGIGAVTMMAVAKGAGVSRQAAYLHFEERGELLAALVDRIDRENDLERWIDRIRRAPTAALAIKAAADMQAGRNHKIVALVRALDVHRHEDSAAARAWRSRLEGRLAGARHVVDRLAASGGLHATWNREEAAILLCELLSIRVWDDLVNEHGLSSKTYVAVVTDAVLSALAAPRRRIAAKAR